MISRFILNLLFCSVVSMAGVALASGINSTGHSHDDRAIGKPGEASQVDRTIDIEMNDSMRFIPDKLNVKQGETIRFMIKNIGQKKHEFVLGTQKELEEHNEMMQKFPGMEHEDANMISLRPGQTGEVIWHFSKTGKVNFACLLPGHYDAGMTGEINISTETQGGQGSKVNGSAGHNH
jgi:uncharacterized cupredoxin-like copper-binding protein